MFRFAKPYPPGGKSKNQWCQAETVGVGGGGNTTPGGKRLCLRYYIRDLPPLNRPAVAVVRERKIGVFSEGRA